MKNVFVLCSAAGCATNAPTTSRSTSDLRGDICPGQAHGHHHGVRCGG
jgi:hypothetical protein